MWMLLKVRKLGRTFPINWKEILKELEKFTPTLRIMQVMWKFLAAEWVKYNTDGASKGNPGTSSYDFV